jgi:hypothetical protein
VIGLFTHRFVILVLVYIHFVDFGFSFHSENITGVAFKKKEFLILQDGAPNSTRFQCAARVALAPGKGLGVRARQCVPDLFNASATQPSSAPGRAALESEPENLDTVPFGELNARERSVRNIERVHALAWILPLAGPQNAADHHSIDQVIAAIIWCEAMLKWPESVAEYNSILVGCGMLKHREHKLE